MVSFPYYSNIFRDAYGGVVWGKFYYITYISLGILMVFLFYSPLIFESIIDQPMGSSICHTSLAVGFYVLKGHLAFGS